MTDIQKVDEIVEQWANLISIEIAERALYNIDENTAFAKTRLLLALMDCLKIEVNEMEDRKRKMVSQYKDAGKSAFELGVKIGELNKKIKESNRLRHTMKDLDAYMQLKNFVRSVFGKEALHDFYENYLNKPENKTNPGSRG